MRDFVEARRDVGLEHPLVVPRRRSEVVDRGDRVLGSASRAEAVGARLEVRLEDRLEHQLQHGLHNPVSRGRDPQPSELARRLGDQLLAHPGRGEPAGFQIHPDRLQELPLGRDRLGGDPINPGRACALVAPHPVPCHDEERRVMEQVVEVIEPATGIPDRPTVQLGLHREYPRLGLFEARPRSADIHQRPPRRACMLRTCWTPSPCGRLSRPPWPVVTPATTTSPPPHPGGISRRRAFPPASIVLAGEGIAGMVPTFTLEPLDG